jgi:hypothetical protein
LVVPWSAQDQARADPGLFAVVVARLEAVPGGQLGEVSTEAAHLALIWPVSAMSDAKPMSAPIGGYLKPPVYAAPDQDVCGVDM